MTVGWHTEMNRGLHSLEAHPSSRGSVQIPGLSRAVFLPDSCHLMYSHLYLGGEREDDCQRPGVETTRAAGEIEDHRVLKLKGSMLLDI